MTSSIGETNNDNAIHRVCDTLREKQERTTTVRARFRVEAEAALPEQ